MKYLLFLIAGLSIGSFFSNHHGIYTNDDIYYWDDTHLYSETGLVDSIFTNYDDMFEYLSVISADDGAIHDEEFYSILSNYISVISDRENGTVFLQGNNPYTNTFFSVELNETDTIDSYRTINYFID